MRPVLRRLSAAPMFTVLTLITLAVGIGANTAIFSVLNGVLLKPLPFRDPDRLVAIWETSRVHGMEELPASAATYFTFRDEGRTFQDVGLWSTGLDNITGSGEPEQVEALYVTDGLLPLLAEQPLRGRWFTRDDDSPRGAKTVILTYGYWRRKFGGDPFAIGRRILVDGESSEIVGVMPAGFHFMDSHAAVIVPLQLDRTKTFVGGFNLQALARLKPGVTLAEAHADVARMLPIMLDRFPPAPGMTVKMWQEVRLAPSVRPLKSDLLGDIGKVLWVLMATVGVVLLIACANVTNLMLVRAEGRQQELAIRAALGANWRRIAQELLLETVTLGIAGGALGVAVAYAALRVLAAIDPVNLPRLEEISIDRTVLLFNLALSLVSGILFGLIPVFKFAGPRVAGALRQGGRNASAGRERHRARGVLVVVQVALALVLLIGSGLMIRTVRALKQVPPGFTQPEQILTLQVSIPDIEVPNPEQAVRTYNNILERVTAIPGVAAAGLSSALTMEANVVGGYGGLVFAADKTYTNGEVPPERRFKFISPGYFQAMGNPLLAGRDVSWTDIYEGRPVAVVSEALAREMWRDPAAALGKRIREVPKAPWREIVGVVGNERDDGAQHRASTIVYWPMLLRHFWQQDVLVWRYQDFAIRSTRAGWAGLLNEVRQAVWSVNRNLPLANVRTMQEIYDRSMVRTFFTLVMLSIAAGMALLLGVVGIYGVISYAVSQRTRDIGIRIALGAPQESVRWMFVREGLLLTAIGVVCGLAVAAALTRLMTALLFEVSPVDPATYLTVSAFLAAAALPAGYIPARRASAIEPVEALRVE